MGNVVPRSAGVSRITDHFQQTLLNARARAGEVQQAAEDRLSSVEQLITENSASTNDALNALDGVSATLDAADAVSDQEIGAVRDEIWNALGRPAQSTDYTMIFGSSMNAWRNGPLSAQHHKMRILSGNIRLAGHPQLQERKQQWAARIDEKAASQERAAGPLEAADALAGALKNQRRSLANHAQAGLTRLKRDYINSGMTQAQIHEIIPDYERVARKAPDSSDA